MTAESGPNVAPKRSRIRSFGADLLKAVGLYFLCVHGGTILTLVISSIVGYLAYSDRPGPGWYGSHLNLETVSFFAGWGLLLAPYLVVFGLLLFLTARLLRWAHAPKWLIAIVSAFLSGIGSAYIVLGIGWYIALAGFVPLVSGIIGLAYGAFLLPRHIGPAPSWRWRRFHGAALGGAFVAASLLLMYPSFANRDNQAMAVTFKQILPGAEKIDWSTGRTPDRTDELSQLNSLNLSGIVRSGLGYSQGGPTPEARVLVLVIGELSDEVQLPQPKRADAIFLIRGNRWEVHPRETPFIDRHITLRPTGSPDEVRVHIEGNAGANEKDSIFRWYPPR